MSRVTGFDDTLRQLLHGQLETQAHIAALTREIIALRAELQDSRPDAGPLADLLVALGARFAGRAFTTADVLDARQADPELDSLLRALDNGGDLARRLGKKLAHAAAARVQAGGLSLERIGDDPALYVCRVTPVSNPDN